VKRKSYASMNCSIAQALEVVGDPWTLLVVRDVFFGYRRFAELQQRLQIPRNTLSDRLALLVEHGILEKVSYSRSPERFEYRLTEKGHDLRGVIVTLMQWGDKWSDLDEPPVVLVAADGHRVRPVLVDAETGTPLDELGTRAVPTGGG
jgi:DNA-binding HxlR family transcriptional regulator